MFNRLQERRKRQFVDRKQQIQFALTVAFYALMYPILFAFLASVPPFSTLLTDPARVEPLIRQLVGFQLAHWWIGALSLAIIVALSLIFSHKIFGPMSRCEAIIQQAGQPGPEGALQLRRGDYFQEFARQLEQTVKGTEVS